MTRHISLSLALGFLLCCSPMIAAEIKKDISTTGPIWPQWRGQTRDGQIAGLKWPDRLDKASLERLWHIPLGPSYSGPIVTDELVFTTETQKKESEIVYALDRKTGKQALACEMERGDERSVLCRVQRQLDSLDTGIRW